MASTRSSGDRSARMMARASLTPASTSRRTRQATIFLKEYRECWECLWSQRNFSPVLEHESAAHSKGPNHQILWHSQFRRYIVQNTVGVPYRETPLSANFVCSVLNLVAVVSVLLVFERSVNELAEQRMRIRRPRLQFRMELPPHKPAVVL